jgi:hypothetical protein
MSASRLRSPGLGLSLALSVGMTPSGASVVLVLLLSVSTASPVAGWPGWCFLLFVVLVPSASSAQCRDAVLTKRPRIPDVIFFTKDLTG